MSRSQWSACTKRMAGRPAHAKAAGRGGLEVERQVAQGDGPQASIGSTLMRAGTAWVSPRSLAVRPSTTT